MGNGGGLNGTAKWFVGIILAILLTVAGWLMSSQARSDEKQWDKIHGHGVSISDNKASVGTLAATLDGVTIRMQKMDERNTAWQLRADDKLDRLLGAVRQ